MTNSEVTLYLDAASDGDPDALARVLPLVYEDLRIQAERFLRKERADHTLQATALVHEAYLRLVDQTRVKWQGRSHFFAVAAMAMRRILVNHARDQGRQKRGGGRKQVDLSESALIQPEADIDLIALDDAMNRLAEVDPRSAKVVELRYFGGLSVDESAEVLNIGPATVKRDWLIAKSWLLREISGDSPDQGAAGERTDA